MACDWFKLFIKWIFFFIVPTLAGIFLFISSKYAFEIATTSWQIFIGIVLFIIWITYEILVLVYLIKETKECFENG